MIRALLLDAGGTLLHPAEPVPLTYVRVARSFGVERGVDEVERGFEHAFDAPVSGLRYVGDGRLFWRRVVHKATGTRDPQLFEALYRHYARAEAWQVAPGARQVLARCQAEGVRTGLVSNWDLRLRPLLEDLELTRLLDSISISAEVGAEKPDPAIVHAALAPLQVAPEHAVLVGDRPEDTLAAARTGCAGWQMPGDVADFSAIEARIFGSGPN